MIFNDFLSYLFYKSIKSKTKKTFQTLLIKMKMRYENVKKN